MKQNCVLRAAGCHRSSTKHTFILYPTPSQLRCNSCSTCWLFFSWFRNMQATTTSSGGASVGMQMQTKAAHHDMDTEIPSTRLGNGRRSLEKYDGSEGPFSSSFPPTDNRRLLPPRKTKARIRKSEVRNVQSRWVHLLTSYKLVLVHLTAASCSAVVIRLRA